MYALVDCNSFFASCEQIFRPDLRGKPVVVLSNNDGCIVARSKEAKELNVPDLLAYFKVRDYLQKHNVHVFSSNYELYGDISSRVVQVLRDYAPDMEIYSIDECFLLLDGMHVDYKTYGRQIKDKIWQDVRMPVGVGIAQTQTLSKLANHIAKKSKKLDGVCVIENTIPWHEVFKKIPVNNIWGVGRQLTKRLAYLDIYSVYDLKKADPKLIRKHSSVNLERTICELNGERCFDLQEKPPPKKQIYSTRSFGERVHSIEGLHQAVSQYATRAAKKLRKQNCQVKTILAFIETSRFESNRYHNSAVVQLPIATDDTRMIIEAAKHAVNQIFKPGFRYYKAGVGLIEIIERSPQQLNFFNAYQSKKSEQLMKVVDQLNIKEPQVFFASSGVDPFWKMQRNLKSPAYTTQLADIPKIPLR